MFKMWKHMDTTSRKSKTMSKMQITILEQTKKKGGEKMETKIDLMGIHGENKNNKLLSPIRRVTTNTPAYVETRQLLSFSVNLKAVSFSHVLKASLFSNSGFMESPRARIDIIL